MYGGLNTCVLYSKLLCVGNIDNLCIRTLEIAAYVVKLSATLLLAVTSPTLCYVAEGGAGYARQCSITYFMHMELLYVSH